MANGSHMSNGQSSDIVIVPYIVTLDDEHHEYGGYESYRWQNCTIGSGVIGFFKRSGSRDGGSYRRESWWNINTDR